MAYDHNGAAYEDDDDEIEQPRTNFFSKLRNAFTRNGDEDEYYEDEPQAASSRATNQAQQAAEQQTVARVPAPHRSAGGSLNPVRRPATVAQIRIDRDRPMSVTVRRTVQSFEDVRRAVEGLREGVQQIVNIEQTPADVAERLIDFLNGATYALDGSVEKIGAQVYLFTPHSITIDVEDKAKAPISKPFFDRE